MKNKNVILVLAYAQNHSLYYCYYTRGTIYHCCCSSVNAISQIEMKDEDECMKNEQYLQLKY